MVIAAVEKGLEIHHVNVNDFYYDLIVISFRRNAIHSL